MGRQELIRLGRKPARLVAVGIFALLLTAGSAYAQVQNLVLTVSQQIVDANHEGVRQDLLVKASINVHCDGSGSQQGTLTVSTTLTDPKGDVVGSATKSLAATCGEQKVHFILNDFLTVKGRYTITTTASVGSVTVTETHSFDPTVDGSMGPL